MRNVYLTFGIIFLAISGYIFFLSGFTKTSYIVIGVITLIVALYLIAQDVRAMMAGKNITSMTYSSIVEQGLKKIQNGNTLITKEDFISKMEKIKSVLSEQQFVPVVGYDSVYLQYNNETGANRALEEVKRNGLEADLIQDKSTWSVRIHF
jgi:hypothetical protein